MNIKIVNVSKIIKKTNILSDISLELNSGVVYGLQGINGSGKTMLMRVILGLIRPTSGYVEIDGKQLWKNLSFPESCGFLLENPSFLDNYTGSDNLKLIASVKGKINREQIRQTLVRVGLDPEDKRKYKKYSLGMRQRLGIASAIMEKPDLILLDEPTNALDKDGVELVKNIVFEEKERGALVVLACHDENILYELVDEIFFMENGIVKEHKTLTKDNGEI